MDHAQNIVFLPYYDLTYTLILYNSNQPLILK